MVMVGLFKLTTSGSLIAPYKKFTYHEVRQAWGQVYVTNPKYDILMGLPEV